ncbi:MAG: hypothetical protein ACI80S_001018 [Pseudohongiellaceae bacterium]|jgi:hypothetical protein
MYILHNQDGYFLTKSGDWSDGRELPPLFKTMHKDEAINQLFETNSKDYKLRLSLLECEINSKKMPLIPDEKLPPVLKKIIDVRYLLEKNLLESEVPRATEQDNNVEAQ